MPRRVSASPQGLGIKKTLYYLQNETFLVGLDKCTKILFYIKNCNGLYHCRCPYYGQIHFCWLIYYQSLAIVSLYVYCICPWLFQLFWFNWIRNICTLYNISFQYCFLIWLLLSFCIRLFVKWQILCINFKNKIILHIILYRFLTHCFFGSFLMR